MGTRTRPGRPPRSKLVVMNGAPRHIKGLPEPTRPVDDFSVALWAFAEFVLEKNKGLEAAQINYWGGRALHNLYDVYSVRPEHTIAQLWFFPDAARYVQARKQNAWPASVFDLDVHADGSLWRWLRGPNRVGNILTWKFSKAALNLGAMSEVM